MRTLIGVVGIVLLAGLTSLAAQDQRKAAILELHVFGGLTYEETARVLDLSPATVNRELRFAKAWVFKEVKAQRARQG